MTNCVVVGLGNIGWRYDVGIAGVLSHAKAIDEHSHLQLIAAIDPDPQACAAFSQEYPRVATFATLREAAERYSIDWVVLALPTHLHYAAFLEALDLNPRVIICEKPIAHSSAQAQELLNLAKAQGVLVFVNYIRPHEPHCRAMINFIRQGAWGRVEKIIVRYGKGITNNASHFIHLLVHAFGAPEQVRLINTNGVDCVDPEPDFILHFGTVQAVFLRFDYQLYALSEMDIYLQQGAVFYRAMGRIIEYQPAQADALFPSVKTLQGTRTEETQLDYYQRHALAYYYSVWQGHSDMDASTQAAVQALIAIEQVLAQIPPLSVASFTG